MKFGKVLQIISYVAVILLSLTIYLRYVRSNESNRELKQQIKELE